MLSKGVIALGMPKGFNRVEVAPSNLLIPHDDLVDTLTARVPIMLWDSMEAFYATYKIGKFNVPIWVMEQDGYLFLRVISPRINALSIHVIRGGYIDNNFTRQGIGGFTEVPTYDVGSFINEID